MFTLLALVTIVQFASGATEMTKSLYDFKVQTAQGTEQSLNEYKGKVVLVVNVASKCAFTPQYDGLEKVYKTYEKKNFVILGFPSNQFGSQEPAGDQEIQKFCKTNYGVTFPVFAKVDVNGPNAIPLYEWLKSGARGIFKTETIKWNFTKFLIDKKGNVIARYAPQTKPEAIVKDIDKALAAAD